MEDHQDVIKKIEQIRPSFVGGEIDTSTCPGKADILFWYGTHEDRILIEDIIAGDTFMGYLIGWRIVSLFTLIISKQNST